MNPPKNIMENQLRYHQLRADSLRRELEEAERAKRSIEQQMYSQTVSPPATLNADQILIENNLKRLKGLAQMSLNRNNLQMVCNELCIWCRDLRAYAREYAYTFAVCTWVRISYCRQLSKAR
jgi:hypothetical protein